VVALRIQTERGGGPAAREYVPVWGLTEERIARHAPRAWIMHPGPTNEGVEITAELANGPRSLIGRQVENGVPVRMAVLALVTGRA
jgi:aspartate carbamoyltransferase catalytic subunit